MFENRAPGFRRQPITYDYHNLRVAATQGEIMSKYNLIQKLKINLIYIV